MFGYLPLYVYVFQAKTKYVATFFVLIPIYYMFKKCKQKVTLYK